ncbi:MAG: GNAT family N-acetyltransferase [Pseudomonadota bacterium]
MSTEPRAIAARDIDAIAALQAEYLDPAWTSEAIDTLLKGAWGLGLASGDPPRGFCLARCVGDEAELLSIVVAAPFRRFGLAKRLIMALANELGKRNIRRLFLEVAEDNSSAIAFYNSLGFRVDGHRPRYYPRPSGRVAALLLSAKPLDLQHA